MEKENSVSGDLKILALAVKALIDTHPDKKAFHRLFLEYLDHPERGGTYTANLAEIPRDISLMQSLLKSGFGSD